MPQRLLSIAAIGFVDISCDQIDHFIVTGVAIIHLLSTPRIHRECV